MNMPYAGDPNQVVRKIGKLETIALDTIEDKVYDTTRAEFNIQLCDLLSEIASGTFSAGEITLKISYESNEDSEQNVIDTSDGEVKDQLFYNRIQFTYDISTTLKRKNKLKGIYNEKRAFKLVDGRFIAEPIRTAQVTMRDVSERGDETA